MKVGGREDGGGRKGKRLWNIEREPCASVASVWAAVAAHSFKVKRQQHHHKPVSASVAATRGCARQ